MRTKIVIIILFACMDSFGQTVLELEAGYFKKSNSIAVDKDLQQHSNFNNFPLYCNIFLGYQYKKVSSYTRLINYFEMKNPISYNPGYTEYIVGVKYTLNRLEIGYEHSCTHPVITYTTAFYNYYRESYDKLVFRIKVL